MKRFTNSDFRPRIFPGAFAGDLGQSLFEVAIAMPVLSMLLVGIIFGGITFYNYVELTDAVAAGARTLAESRLEGVNACTRANNAITQSAGNLQASLITIVPESFQGSGGATCTALVPGDAGTVAATYPCNLPIPFTSVNLCPVQGTNSAQGTNNPNCPTAYCISATTTVYLQ